MLTRAWQLWRAKSILLAPVVQIRHRDLASQVLYREFRERPQVECPEHPPYHALAEFFQH